MYHFPKKEEEAVYAIAVIQDNEQILCMRENNVVSMSATGFSFLMEKNRERNIKETYIQQDN